MKKVLLLTVFITIFLSQIKAIDYFTGTYQEALLQAKNDNKFLLLYFTAKWCGPCRYISSYILTDPEIEALVSANYIALKLDVDLEENKVIFFKYFQEKGVSIPRFLVINSKEEVFNQLLGAAKANQFKKFLINTNNYGLRSIMDFYNMIVINDESIDKIIDVITPTINVVTMTKNNVGVTNGNVILKNFLIGPAPSISAAS